MALLSTQSDAFTFFAMNVDTGFLLVMLCIRPFAKISGNENKVGCKGILKISRLIELFLQRFNEIENKVYKVLRGLPTLPISKRPELNEDRLFWMEMSIMKQQNAFCMMQASLIKRK